jgi:UDP-N-acetylmuramyl pentapeptide phosphotransferase/UDP-N-acetylglucosamine-1-phosphate transferase
MTALLVGAMAATAGLAALLTIAAVRYAPRVGFVAYPDEINRHAHPVPLLGGAAIFAAAAPATAYVVAHHSPWRGFLPSLAMTLALGLYKDRHRGQVPEAAQLLAQLAAVGVLWWGGLGIETRGAPWIDGAATVVVGLAVLNAINFLDVLDALAGSIVAVVLAGFGGLALTRGALVEASFALLLAASVAGFLAQNTPPARIYLGDAGSFGLGISLVALAFSAAAHPGHGILPPALLLLVPLLELAATVALRLVAGKSPFRGDGTHVSTLLRRRGWAITRIVACALALSVAAAVGALLLAEGA